MFEKIENWLFAKLLKRKTSLDSTLDGYNARVKLSKQVFAILEEDLYEDLPANIAKEHIITCIESIPDNYLRGLGNEFGGDISEGIKKMAEIELRSRKLI